MVYKGSIMGDEEDETNTEYGRSLCWQPEPPELGTSMQRSGGQVEACLVGTGLGCFILQILEEEQGRVSAS